MSRPASQALGGFYKTQDEIRPLICRRFAKQDAAGAYCVCDPCAGEGEAVIEAVNHIFGPLKDRRRPVYGGTSTKPEVSLVMVELEEERYCRADSAAWGCSDLRQARRGDGLCCDASGAGCSLLWLNPPYDFFRGQRFEARFLDAWTPRIVGGGQLVLIVPEHALPHLAATLTTWFDDLAVLRYPEPTYSEFKQVVVLGRKRTLAGVAGPLPSIGNLADEPRTLRVVPPGALTVDVNALDVAALRAATTPWSGQAGYARPATPPQIGLAMRPKPAHVAMALGSGVFNGVRLSAPGQPDILAKAVFHRQFVDADSKKDEHGEVVKLTQVERPQLRLTTLDLSSGEYRELSPATEPSGKMENFADLLLAYGDSMVAAMRERCPSLHEGQEDVPLRPMARSLFPAQAAAVRAALKLVARGQTPLILGEIGSGKCLKIGTKVLLYSGERLAVEDVRPGHLLMGPDSKPRKVLGTTRGTGPLFEVSPVQGAPWVCNDAHILTLVHTMSGDVFDISIQEYTSQKRLKLHLTKGNRTTHPVVEFKQFFPETGVDFAPAAPLPLNPYFFGVWCGDGTKDLNSVAVTKPDPEIKALMEETASAWGLKLRCSINNDRCPTWTITSGQTGGQKNPLLSLLRELVVNDELPASYLTAARKDRQAFLAGFLDTDGYLHNNCFEIVQKRESWADAICFIATSLGIRATRTVKYVNQIPYHRVQLSGDFTQLPLRLPRKQAGQRATTSKQYGGSRSMKKVNRTGIKVRPVGVGEYAGFELDGDGRFLLGDFTVTHNTSVALSTLWNLNDTAALNAIRNLRIEHETAFPALARVPLVRRALVVCPPHLVKNWQDEARACLPSVPVVVLERVSDVEAAARMTDPLVLCVLSREQAKLGHGIEGVAGKHCPRCGRTMAGDQEKRGKSRAVCDKHVSEPLDVLARIAHDMRRGGTHGRRAAIVPLLRLLRAGTSRKKESWGGYSHKMPGETQTKLVEMLKLCAPDPRVLRCLRRIYPKTVKYGQSVPTEQDILSKFEHNEDDATLRRALAELGKWKTTPCGEPLYQAVPQPRRFPLADYICRKHPKLFQLVIPDEFHEYSTEGSAQERALHRLTEKIPLCLPLTGSLMNGYAKSLFRNLWAVSRRMREEFAYDEHGKFCKLYGYQKRVLTGDALKKAVVTEFGGSSDRVVKTEGGERLSDAPGVLPSFVLRHVLPLSVTLHKRDITPDDRVVDHDRAEIPIVDATHRNNGYELGADLKDAVTKDRYDEQLAGKLFGQLAEYPSYFDRATDDTGNAGPSDARSYEIRYPEDVGGNLVSAAAGLPRANKLAKEEWLVSLLRREFTEGRNVLIFLWHKELADRLIGLCREAGEVPAFLDANKVQAKKRQDWIDKNVVGKRRIMITNPSCVQTGLNNLIWFSSAVFFENPGCNPFVARQAVGRLDRITQTKEVRVYWPVYEGVQCALLDLLQAKTAISQQIDGIDPTAALEMAGAGDGAQVQTQDVGLAVYKYLGGD